MIEARFYTTQLQAGLGLIEETRQLLDVYVPGMTVTQLYDAALASGRFPLVTARRLRNIVAECFAPRYLRDPTGHADTAVASLGTVTRAETELVEFIEGQSSTRYPVTAITASTWQHTDLGTVTASGQSIMAAVAGYSLLRITYTTTSLDWRVALPVDEEVQFVLVAA